MSASVNPASTLWRLSAVSVALACVFAAGQAQANGTDPTVVAGQASFSTQGSSLSITNSPGAIINWQGFSIGASEATNFIQQSATSSVLNRVIGPDPSVILGTLTSNGRVFLINPSGILVGQGARIDVAGLTASTLNLSNQDFLAGRFNFTSNPLAGTVENQGSITTPSGGSVYLVGANVTNSGIINSPQGDVILAAGQSVNIFDTSTPGVRVELTASDNAAVNLGKILAQSGQVGIYGAALRNSGLINADQVVKDASGKIVLRAKNDVTLDAGSNISANGEQGGEITVQSKTGTTLVSGTIEAKGTGAAGKGGDVQLLGNRVGLLTASVDASGTTGGGTVLVGGDYQGKNSSVQNAQASYVSSDASVKADAITSGNGGKVIVWADDSTRTYGSITARGGALGGDGGLIETSAHWLDVAGINVNASAPHGKGGTWLLDPADVTITGAVDSGGTFSGGNPDVFTPSTGLSSSNVNLTTITTALNLGTDVTINTVNSGASGGGAGDISVNAVLTWSVTAPTTPSTLTLNAVRDVNVTSAITATRGNFTANAGRNVNVSAVITTTGDGAVNNGNIVLRADSDGTGPGVAGGTVAFLTGGSVTMTGGAASIYYNPGAYATPTNYLSNFTLTTSTLNSYMWVFAQGNNKPYDGTGAATLSFKGTPTGGGVVTLAPGTAAFDTKNAGTGKTVTYSGYSLGGADANKFALFSSAGTTTANITQAALTLSTSNVTKTYDGGLTAAGTAVVSSGTLFSGDTLSGGSFAFTDKNVGIGNKTVTTAGVTVGDGVNNGNYSVGYASNTTSTINQAALAINAVTDSRVYNGTTNSAGVVTYSGLQTGDTLTGLGQSYASKNVLGANLSTLNVNGGYTLTDGNAGGNYSVTTNSAAGTITPLGITGSIAAANKVYDANNSATILTRTLSGTMVGDTVSYSGGTAIFSDKNAASGKTVTGTGLSLAGTDAGNYTVNNTATTTASITPAPLGIAANGASKIYGSTKSFSGTEFSSTGLKNGETVGNVNLASAGAVATAGVAGSPYAITASAASGGTFNAGNYTISYVNGALGVTPAPLGIAANSATRLYGDANPAFSATYTGFQNGEDSTALSGALALNTSAILISNVGNYAIIPSGQSSTNYAITYVNGALGVTPAPLGIAANSASKIYGSTKSFSGTEFSSTGLKNGETVGSVGLASAGAVATAGVAGSPYVITASAASGGTFNAGNYTISYVNGTLGVTPAPLGIAANSATRLYGDANPAFSATYTGFQNGENSAALTGTLALSTPAIPASNVGNYAIIPSGQSSTNYTIAYVNGALGVIPASLMVIADAKSKVYGTSDPALTFSTTGLVYNPALGVTDTAATVLSGALTRANGETVVGGSYAITRGTLAANSNYTLSSFTGNTLAITPAVLAVSANGQSKVYGTSDPALTFGTTGLVNNPALGIADTTATVLSGALTRASGETVVGGSYAITQGTLAANSNYTLGSFAGNILAITPAALNVAANPQNKLFGTSDPTLTFNVTGLVNNPSLGIADTAATVLSGALTRVPGESALGGPYAITQGSIVANSNYTLGFTPSNLIITGAAAEPVLGFNAGQVIFAGVINNEFYYRPGNFWHIALNSNNADPGFDVMRGTNDLNSRLRRSTIPCDSIFGGGFCETWSFPQQREKVNKK